MCLTSRIPLALGATVPAAPVAPRGAQPGPASSITIGQLIDIKPPSNPIWSRDGRRIVFPWGRAGVSNLYPAPADGSAKPVQLTTDGVPGNVFWSPDSASLLFFRGASLMALPLDGSAPKPRLANFAGRSPSVSRDGTRIVYLSGGVGGARGGGGGRGGGRGRGGAAPAEPAPEPAGPPQPTENPNRAPREVAHRPVTTVHGPNPP